MIGWVSPEQNSQFDSGTTLSARLETFRILCQPSVDSTSALRFVWSFRVERGAGRRGFGWLMIPNREFHTQPISHTNRIKDRAKRWLINFHQMLINGSPASNANLQSKKLWTSCHTYSKIKFYLFLHEGSKFKNSNKRQKLIIIILFAAHWKFLKI